MSGTDMDDRIAAVMSYCDAQAQLSWRDGMTADEARGRNVVAERVLALLDGTEASQ